MATLQLNSRLQSRLGITPDQLAEFCQRWHAYELALFGSVLRDEVDLDEVWAVINENLPQLLAHIEPLTLPES